MSCTRAVTLWHERVCASCGCDIPEWWQAHLSGARRPLPLVVEAGGWLRPYETVSVVTCTDQQCIDDALYCPANDPRCAPSMSGVRYERKDLIK